MLKVDNISLYYGAAQALRGVSIAAEPGKVTCLHEGTVLAEGTIDQVSSNERVIEVYLGR
jgi:ABC-type branched-subunit amino acid transport system ATPase component